VVIAGLFPESFCGRLFRPQNEKADRRAAPEMAEKILVIDDQMNIFWVHRMLIEGNTGDRVETTRTHSEILKRLFEASLNRGVTPLKAAGVDGMELFFELKTIAPALPFAGCRPPTADCGMKRRQGAYNGRAGSKEPDI
jgi:hypothetical protein